MNIKVGDTIECERIYKEKLNPPIKGVIVSLKHGIVNVVMHVKYSAPPHYIRAISYNKETYKPHIRLIALRNENKRQKENQEKHKESL